MRTHHLGGVRFQYADGTQARPNIVECVLDVFMREQFHDSLGRFILDMQQYNTCIKFRKLGLSEESTYDDMTTRISE